MASPLTQIVGSGGPNPTSGGSQGPLNPNAGQFIPSPDYKSVSIEKLNGNNYSIWKIQMEAILNRNKHKGIVDDTIPDPGAADPVQQLDWQN